MGQVGDLPGDNPWSKKVRKLRKENPRYTRPPQPMDAIERYIEAKAIQDYHRIAAVHDLICQLVSELTLDDPLSPEEKKALEKNKKHVKENPKLKKAESIVATARKLFEKVSYSYDQRTMPVSSVGKQDNGKLYTRSSRFDDNMVYDEKHGWMEYQRGSNVGCALPAKEMIDAVVKGAEPRQLIEKVMNA